MHFSDLIVRWYELYGRHNLPWQGTKDPYRIWLSEVMLQQTQVVTVIPYYQAFLKQFPSIQELASAKEKDIMSHWAGLGYYARALNLHRCAKIVVSNFDGKFPKNSREINLLPGIGRSTAAAIAAFAYQERSPIMDGNVKRIFARYFSIHEDINKVRTINKLWKLAEEKIRESKDLNMINYTQGLIDLGATLCKPRKPECFRCPVSTTCLANIQGRQSEFPRKKVKKKQPEQETCFFIAQAKEFFLFEKRPKNGIWRSLWSFPEFDASHSPLSVAKKLGLIVNGYRELQEFVHVFSHYRLRIKPIYLTVSFLSEVSVNSKKRYVWVKKEELKSTPIPSPVRKLLNLLEESLF